MRMTCSLAARRQADHQAERTDPGPRLARRKARALTEEAAVESARAVWSEAEGFEPAPGGLTFRVGGGHAWITNSGRVAADPEGLRSRARQHITA